MTTEAAPAAEAVTSKEDKFFGITTSIDDMNPETSKEDEPEIIVEHAEDTDDKVATPAEPALKETTPETKKETGATDEDIKAYSDKVQKRINKLTYQAKEAERQRDVVMGERNEAFRVATQLYNQSQQQAHIISTGEARLVDQIKATAHMSVQAASAKSKKAQEEGDTDEIIKAQNEMIIAQHENKAALDYDAEYQQRVQTWASQQQQQQQQQQYRQQFQQPPPQPRPAVQRAVSEESKSWAGRNPWFNDNKHRDMTAVAYATHETMIRDEGIKPDSDEYYQKLDATVRLRFPEYFEADTPKPNAIVAPATRTGSKTRTVRLKPSERQLAKAIGITEEQYAKQLLKERT